MTPTGPPTTAPRPEQLAFLYEARATSSVLEASVELGVLEWLGPKPVRPQTLALACGIGVDAAHTLLQALASLGLAEPDGDGAYRGVACDVPEFLEMLRPWDHLAHGLRHRPGASTGTSQVPDDGYSRIVRPLAAVYASAADEHCVVTALDLPPVLEVTRQAVAAAGFTDRFRFVGGDLFAVELEERAFDLVVVGHLCHLFDEPTNRRLFSRVAGWLAPGGTVAVINVLPSESADNPRAVTLYAVGLARRRPGGQVYPFSSYARWLRATGDETVERIELSPYLPVTLVRARRL